MRFVSACQGGQSAGMLGGAMPRMRAVATQIGAALPPTALELPELRLLTA